MAIEMLTNAHNLLIIIYAVWRRAQLVKHTVPTVGAGSNDRRYQTFS